MSFEFVTKGMQSYRRNCSCLSFTYILYTGKTFTGKHQSYSPCTENMGSSSLNRKDTSKERITPLYPYHRLTPIF